MLKKYYLIGLSFFSLLAMPIVGMNLWGNDKEQKKESRNLRGVRGLKEESKGFLEVATEFRKQGEKKHKQEELARAQDEREFQKLQDGLVQAGHETLDDLRPAFDKSTKWLKDTFKQVMDDPEAEVEEVITYTRPKSRSEKKENGWFSNLFSKSPEKTDKRAQRSQRRSSTIMRENPDVRQSLRDDIRKVPNADVKLKAHEASGEAETIKRSQENRDLVEDLNNLAKVKLEESKRELYLLRQASQQEQVNQSRSFKPNEERPVQHELLHQSRRPQDERVGNSEKNYGNYSWSPYNSNQEISKKMLSLVKFNAVCDLLSVIKEMNRIRVLGSRNKVDIKETNFLDGIVNLFSGVFGIFELRKFTEKMEEFPSKDTHVLAARAFNLVYPLYNFILLAKDNEILKNTEKIAKYNKKTKRSLFKTKVVQSAWLAINKLAPYVGLTLARNVNENTSLLNVFTNPERLKARSFETFEIVKALSNISEIMRKYCRHKAEVGDYKEYNFGN